MRCPRAVCPPYIKRIVWRQTYNSEMFRFYKNIYHTASPPSDGFGTSGIRAPSSRVRHKMIRLCNWQENVHIQPSHSFLVGSCCCYQTEWAASRGVETLIFWATFPAMDHLDSSNLRTGGHSESGTELQRWVPGEGADQSLTRAMTERIIKLWAGSRTWQTDMSHLRDYTDFTTAPPLFRDVHIKASIPDSLSARAASFTSQHKHVLVFLGINTDTEDGRRSKERSQSQHFKFLPSAHHVFVS